MHGSRFSNWLGNTITCMTIFPRVVGEKIDDITELSKRRKGVGEVILYFYFRMSISPDPIHVSRKNSRIHLNLQKEIRLE